MKKLFPKSIILLFVLLFILGSLTFAKQFEGPSPTTFDQAPMLDKLVESGELPPVEERLPEKEDLYVVDPNQSIGVYGGTANTAGLSISSDGADEMLLSSPMLIKPNAEGNGFEPHFAKNIEVSEDKTTFIIHFRRGVKWSDGYPFTTEDVMFWYNDILLNKELTPVVGSSWKSNGKVMKMEKIDDYTVKVIFDGPKPFFFNGLYMDTNYWSMITPKHYLSKFHVDYVDKEKLEAKAKEAGYDYWYQLFRQKYLYQYGLPLNPDLPTVTAYRLVQKDSSRRVFERNPYFWKVDPEGNQLPYIDKISNEIVSDKEVLQGRIMSGQIDFAAYNTDIRNYPMYKQYEEKGGYRTILWRAGFKSDVVYMFNLTAKNPALRKIFQNVKFRRAMSLAIDRKNISDSIYFGKAKPVQFTVLDLSKYYDPEYETYVEYNPQKAKELLDEIGLVDQDGDGWRDRPDGKKFTFTVEYITAETPKTPNVQLVKEYWRSVGIDVETKQVSGELQTQRAPANLLDATVWHGDIATDMLFPVQPYFVVPYAPAWSKSIWPEWARWFQTNGKSGEEPPQEIKQLRSWWEQIMIEPDSSKRKELVAKILKTQSEKLWTIGTIGKAPWPAIANKNLKNLPEQVLWCWDTLWTISRDPEQFYFEKE